MQYLAKESFDYIPKRKYFVNFYSFFYSMAFPTDLDDVDQRIIWVALTVEYLHSVLYRDKHTNYHWILLCLFNRRYTAEWLIAHTNGCFTARWSFMIIHGLDTNYGEGSLPQLKVI